MNENIFLKDTDNDKIKFIYASTGKLINNDDERNLKLFDGKIINVNNEKITSFDFKTTNFDLGKYLTKSIIDFKLQERKTSDILNCYINYFILENQSYYETTQCNDPAIKEMQKEIFNRLIKPLFIPILTLSLCFLLIIPKENVRYKLSRVLIFNLGFKSLIQLHSLSLITCMIINLI